MFKFKKSKEKVNSSEEIQEKKELKSSKKSSSNTKSRIVDTTELHKGEGCQLIGMPHIPEKEKKERNKRNKSIKENKDKTIKIISIILLILGIIFIMFILPMRRQEAREKAFRGCMSLEKDYEYCKELLELDSNELPDY